MSPRNVGNSRQHVEQQFASSERKGPKRAPEQSNAMKNPWLSAWLSASNAAFGAARGHATAAAKRSIANAQRETTQQLIELWFGPAPKKKRKQKGR